MGKSFDSKIPVVEPGTRRKQPDARIEAVDNFRYMISWLDQRLYMRDMLAIFTDYDNIGIRVSADRAFIGQDADP